MRKAMYRVFDPEAQEWIYSEPFDDEINEYVFRIFQEYPETIGQFTGLKDKNSVAIYDGDIVQYQNKTTGIKKKLIIGWDDEYFGYIMFSNSKKTKPEPLSFCIGIGKSISVIGNIYEDPELLKQLK